MVLSERDPHRLAPHRRGARVELYRHVLVADVPHLWYYSRHWRELLFHPCSVCHFRMVSTPERFGMCRMFDQFTNQKIGFVFF